MGLIKFADDNPENSNGYVWVYLPDHPNAMSNGYIYEHRLVMEQYLGRFLRNNEQVQHKDGVQDNNNIGNLELWVDDPKLGLIRDTISDKIRKTKDVPDVLQKDYKAKKKLERSMEKSSAVSRVVLAYLAKGSKI